MAEETGDAVVMVLIVLLILMSVACFVGNVRSFSPKTYVTTGDGGQPVKRRPDLGR